MNEFFVLFVEYKVYDIRLLEIEKNKVYYKLYLEDM